MADTHNEGPLSKLSKLLGLDDLAPIAAVKRIEEKPVQLNPELFFHTDKRRNMVYDRVPVRHDTGYRCYDGSKHDSQSAFESGEYGDGLSENEAYFDWLRNVDEPQPRAGIPFAGNGNSEPVEYRDAPRGDPDDVTFDDDLTDDPQ